MNFFIDESGNTGDIRIKNKEDFHFNGQPYFVLAGIGIYEENQSIIDTYVKDLRSYYCIQSAELKSSKLYDSKPDLIVELMNYFRLKQYPIFVEINDKKYFLCIQINNLICRSILDNSPNDLTLTIIQRAADYLYDVLPTRVFILFSNACRERDQKLFDEFVSSLSTVLLLSTDDLGQMLYRFLQRTVGTYLMRSYEVNDEKLLTSLLPEPDIGTKGQIMSALPNIPALSSIMARTEKYRRDNGIVETAYIHDEQAHFFRILHENMALLREKDFSEFSSNNHLNGFVHYHLDKFSLVEGDSKNLLGIQIADIISGTVYRVWSEFIRNGFRLPSKYESVFSELIASYDGNHQSVGVNFVVPQRHFDACMRTCF